MKNNKKVSVIIDKDNKFLYNGEEVNPSSLFWDNEDDNAYALNNVVIDGDLFVDGNLDITGDLSVSGTKTFANTAVNITSSNSNINNNLNLNNTTASGAYLVNSGFQSGTTTNGLVWNTSPTSGTSKIGITNIIDTTNHSITGNLKLFNYSDPAYLTGMLLYNQFTELFERIIIKGEKKDRYKTMHLGQMLRKIKVESLGKNAFAGIRSELSILTGIEIAMRVKLTEKNYDSLQQIIPLKAYLLFNKPSRKFIYRLLATTKNIEILSYLLVSQKISEKKFLELLNTISKKNRIPLINAYFLNSDNKITEKFIRDNFVSINQDLLTERILPDKIFDEFVLKDISFDDPRIYDFTISEDYFIKNFDQFSLPYKFFLSKSMKNVLTDKIYENTRVKDLMIRDLVEPVTDYYTNYINNNLYGTRTSYYANYTGTVSDIKFYQNFDLLTAFLNSDNLSELIMLIAGKEESMAKACMNSIVSSNLRQLSEYEILENNKYINRDLLKQVYGTRINQGMPGLKLLLELE